MKVRNIKVVSCEDTNINDYVVDELYENLNKAFALVDKIEEKAATLEAEYNIYLRRYAHALGGIENVAVGYLEYSSGIGVDVDSGDIIFTPWSEEDETEV